MRGRVGLSLLLVVGCAESAVPAPRGRSRDAGDGAGPPPDAGGAPDGSKKEPPALGPWGGTWIDPAAPKDAPMRFGAPLAESGKPEIFYPLDGSVHPVNLAPVTFQWHRRKIDNDLFRVSLENGRGRFDFYLVCRAALCAFDLPEKEWLEVAAANRDAEVSLTVAGTGTHGGKVSVSAARGLRFSPEPVRGGLYYWSTSLRGTYRVSFGARKAAPFIRPSSPTNPKSCGGCHSVSRNGKWIAYTSGFGEGALYVAPTAMPDKPTYTPMGGEKNSSTMALAPDGSRVLVSYDAKLVLRRTYDGKTMTTVDPVLLGPGVSGYFPEWSPDGSAIALTLSAERNHIGTAYYDFDLPTGDIGVLPYLGDDFGPAKVIVPAGADYHFYPSWSPDGKWIAFASAPVGLGGGGSAATDGDSTYNTPNARLRLVAAVGGPVYDLVRATQTVGATSTWPKFTPFVQAGGDVMFLTFNSKMDYGFLMRGDSYGLGLRPQLWLAAIDLRQLPAGDPSSAPVWLPFQDVTQANHLPYWTEALGCMTGTAPGGTGGCPEGETCVEGACAVE